MTLETDDIMRDYERAEAWLENYSDGEKLNAFCELMRFREREPLVQELAWAVNRYAGKAWLDDDHYMACEKVRDFVLQPSLDQGTKTGDKPGADSDHTQEPADKSETCHLSSVVEQRFRKPSVSPEPVEASEPAPGNAGNAVDAALRQAVEEALRQIDKRAAYAERGSDLFSARVLADEVRRLRALKLDRAERVYNSGALQEECDRLRALYAQAGKDYASEAELRDALQAKLARVEALPAKWRECQAGPACEHHTLAWELEQALK